MLDQGHLRRFSNVQAKAKHVLSLLPPIVEPGMSEADIADICVQLLAAEGVTESWYYDVPAFVLAGKRTVLSLSGRDYLPCEATRVELGDLVTVDLSPVIDCYWGDCARSFAVGSRTSADIEGGMATEMQLHAELMRIAHPTMVFGELHEHMNGLVADLGYENLDFGGNLGHSIESRRDDRVYIERGEGRCLGDVKLFTFEPHIRKPGSSLGFKHENIYYFAGGSLHEL